MKKQSLCILGSTGSIGLSTLRALSGREGSRFKIALLAAGSSWEELINQAGYWKPERVYLDQPEALTKALSAKGRLKSKWVKDRSGLMDFLSKGSYDRVVLAVSDFEFSALALESILTRQDRSIAVLVASKEPMVVMGSYYRKLAQKNHHQIIPVDSEPSAIFQCLGGSFEGSQDIEKVILTASGGPFYRNSIDYSLVTPAMALKHPVWPMGRKITIDSATMVNKALEAMEIEELFGLSLDQIKIMIHPQSLIHSMVEFKNGSVLAQAARPDMILPIHYGLFWPKSQSLSSGVDRMNWDELKEFSFDRADLTRFPCLGVALEAARYTDSRRLIARSALLGADEAVVNEFAVGRVSYARISFILRDTINRALSLFDSKKMKGKTIDRALEVFRWAGEFVRQEALASVSVEVMK